MQRTRGQVYTFYSYKGGTGRTLALANVAWILASRGKRVLCIDWDVEAPGLHRYFAPFLKDAELVKSRGLIDWLHAYVQAATAAAPERVMAAGEVRSGAVPWYSGYADLSRYTQPLRWAFGGGGEIDLVGAGQQDAGYSRRVGAFDWERFYTEYGGADFLDHCVQLLRDEYDAVLIDSRTGVSDTAGICTVQLPDTVALFFTLNNQSIEGVSGVAREILKLRPPRGERPVRLLPVATRIELAEKHKLERRRALVEQRFGEIIALCEPALPEGYLGEMEVLYDPFYAYDEMLATIADQPGRTNSVLAAMERLTGHITGGEVTRLGPVSESRRQEALERYELRKEQEPRVSVELEASTASSGPAPVHYDVFISAGAEASEAATRLHRLLQTFCRPFYAPVDVAPGQDWQARIAQVAGSAEVVIALLSDASVRPGSQQGGELESALAMGARVVPVYLGDMQGDRLAGGPLEPLMRRQGMPLRDDADMHRLTNAVQELLGGREPMSKAADASASVEVWQQREAYSTARAQESKREARFFRRLALGASLATVVGIAVSLSAWRQNQGAETALVMQVDKVEALESDIAAIRTQYEQTRKALAERDELAVTRLSQQLEPLGTAIRDWEATVNGLASSVTGLEKEPRGEKGARERIEVTGQELEVNSAVAQELAAQLAQVRQAVEQVTLSEEPKQGLLERIDALAGRRAKQQGALDQAGDRLAVLRAKHARDSDKSRDRARELWRQGNAAFDRGQLAQAQRDYERARAADPSYAPAINSLGRIAGEGGRLDEALELFQRANKLDPGYAPAAGNIAWALVEKGELVEAEQWAKQALRANPDYSPAKISLQRIEASRKSGGISAGGGGW